MADLDVTLATVRERVAKYQRPGIGEQDTKAALEIEEHLWPLPQEHHFE